MKLLLASGSELYVNQTGRGLWTVDIFPSFHDDGTPVLKDEPVEPTYHAAYSGPCAESDAKSDAASWATW
jgi:hypothetical protein